MKKTSWIAIVILVLVVAGVGVYWYSVDQATPAAPVVSTNQPTNNNNTVANPTSDKEQIISAILAMQKVMASKDVTKIRAYISSYITDATQKAALTKTSDQELLTIAGIISDKPLTADQLRNPSTTYQITDLEAVVTVHTGGTDTKKVTLHKVNGVWR